MNPFRELRRAWKEADFPEVERAASAALELDRTLPELHFRLGFAQLQLGKNVEAVRALEACLGRQPAYPIVQHARMALALARARIDPIAPPPEPPVERAIPISVVICSITPEKFDRVCANYAALLNGLPHEIVGVHDARSLAEGYNRGVKRATGEILVFSHDDIEIVCADFAPKLINRLGQFDLLGIAGTDLVCGGGWIDAGWPHLFGQVGGPLAGGRIWATAFGIQGISAAPMQGLDGVIFATRRHVAEEFQFDEATFDGWHLYDLDFTYRVARAGLKLAVSNDLLVVHQSSGSYGQAWDRDARKFLQKHFPSRELSHENLPPLCAIEVNGADEWRSFTQYMIAGPGG